MTLCAAQLHRQPNYRAPARKQSAIPAFLPLLSSDRQEEFRKLGVKSLALFGSVARNEARSDSDVDLLIEADIEKLSVWGLADIRHQLQCLLNTVQHQPVVHTQTIERRTTQVLASLFGRRKEEALLQLKRLLEPLGIKRFCPHGWGAYQRHLSEKMHEVKWAKGRPKALSANILGSELELSGLLLELSAFLNQS